LGLSCRPARQGNHRTAEPRSSARLKGAVRKPDPHSVHLEDPASATFCRWTNPARTRRQTLGWRTAS